MRKALVGLSSPLFYDYGHPAKRTNTDFNSSPNPILDSPFGLMLLFDEIWFICRSLCPQNMRSLPFVHFLDEEGRLPSMADVRSDRSTDALAEVPLFSQIVGSALSYRPAVDYENALRSTGVFWSEARPDNHTHMLQIGDVKTNADSFNPHNLIFDLVLLNRLNEPSLELATNSFSQQWLDQRGNAAIRAKLTELLVIRGIPNYLAPDGPYHHCVDEVRENQYLKDFRRWITTATASVTTPELRDVKESVEAAMDEAQQRVFLQWLDRRGMYKSVAKSLLGEAVGLAMPGSGLAITAYDEAVKWKETQPLRWQGFLIGAQDTVSQIGQ